MKTSRFYYLLTLRVIATSMIVIISSFLADWLQKVGFFGDALVWQKFDEKYEWEWGWRHVVFVGTGFILFIVSVARTIEWINEVRNINR